MTMRGFLVVLVFVAALALPVRADFDEGIVAYKRGDYAAAVRELWPLAERGHTDSQHYLGLMYANGHGVALDYIQALMWFNLAADMLSPNENQRNAARNRDSLTRKMTPAAVARAQALTRNFTPLQKTEVTPKSAPVPAPRKREPAGSGSGFTVSKDHALTNAHVVSGCAEVRAKRPGAASTKAQVIARDRLNDLALLEVAPAGAAVAKFRDGKGIRQGDTVVCGRLPSSRRTCLGGQCRHRHGQRVGRNSRRFPAIADHRADSAGQQWRSAPGFERQRCRRCRFQARRAESGWRHR